MKITIDPATGELSLDIDATDHSEVEQAMAIAMGIRNGHNGSFFEDDEDSEELSPEELIVPSNTSSRTASPVNDDERIAASLQSREQLETWLYLRRNDRVRGVALAGLAHRFKLSSTAATTRCRTLIDLGYAIRVSRGYYRAVVPDDV